MGVQVEEEWRYRKIRSERASKSAFAYKISYNLKGKEKAKLSYGYLTKAPYSREVIVKITGGAISKKGIRSAVQYISKNGQIELTDSNGISHKTKEEVTDVINLLQENATSFTKDDKTKVKLTQNIVFSASKMVGVKKEDMLEMTASALRAKYPHNYFVMSYHEDTKNPHVHVMLNIHQDTGERINIRKKDLRDIREGYCQQLINLGYDVKATRKYGQDFDAYRELTSQKTRNTYEVVDFGTASYQLSKQNEKTGYLVYQTSNNRQVTIWGKELLDEILRHDIKQGDAIKIKKVGQTTVKVPVYGDDRKTILSWKETKRNQWHLEKADSDFDFSKIKHEKEIRLDTPAQAEKQWVQREKFLDAKELVLRKSYAQDYKIAEKLQHKTPSHKFKF